jgi:hypothetical protein
VFLWKCYAALPMRSSMGLISGLNMNSFQINPVPSCALVLDHDGDGRLISPMKIGDSQSWSVLKASRGP